MPDPLPQGAGRERVPATILNGFLGSGKTTLLNHLLAEHHGLKVAVIVNELGDVGVDGKILQGGERFVELDNGCLCCALNADLDRVLRELCARGGFDHLVIETTGAADPLPIGWTLSRPGLADFFRLDAIVTVVDAPHLERALAGAPETELQIRRADLLVVNKLDLVADGGQAAAGRARALNELAPVLFAVRGEVPWRLVLGDVWRERALPVETHAHDAGPSVESWSLAVDAPADEAVLEDLLAAVPPEVYRVKGLVRAAGGGWYLVNVVAGRIDVVPFVPREPPARGALVFIGPSLARAELRALCARFLDERRG